MIEFRGRQLPIVTLDFETFFGKDYTLQKMPTSSYILDPRFKAHMVGLKYEDEPTQVFPSGQIKKVLGEINWRQTLLLCHHTAFDGFILTQRYKKRPAGYLDTLSMSRAVLGHSIPHRLDSIGQRLGLGGKVQSDSLKASRDLVELPLELYERMAVYCAGDVDLCRRIFDAMYSYVPDEELELIDMTVRMFAEPVLHVNQKLVNEELSSERARKMRILLLSGANKNVLQSTPKFCETLRKLGVTIPMKQNAKGALIPAFAKTDKGMRDLLKHPNQLVRAMVEARLIMKSTIGESRAKHFFDISRSGRMPVYLNYYGAHTGRWSGGNMINLQNLPRPLVLPDGNIDPSTGRLRRSLEAPPGRVLVVADSGQIEARINAWLAGHHELLRIFRLFDRKQGPDAYRVMASKLFKIPLDQVTKTQRFIGKVCVLALGYGMGAIKLQATLENAGVSVSLETAQEYVNIYRQENFPIPRLWKNLQRLIPRLSMRDAETAFGPVVFRHEAIRLPNGLFLRYPDLKISRGDYEGSHEASYRGRNNTRTKLYGGLLCENLVQALARIVIADQMRTIGQRYRVVTTTHDEIVALATEKQAERCLRFMYKTMSTPPAWAPDLPLAAEGGYAKEYSK